MYGFSLLYERNNFAPKRFDYKKSVVRYSILGAERETNEEKPEEEFTRKMVGITSEKSETSGRKTEC